MSITTNRVYVPRPISENMSRIRLNVNQASTVIVPDPVAVSLERVKPDSPLTTKNHELAPERKWTGYLRTALALANTAAVMVSAYYGSTVIQGVATAAWLMMLVRGTYFVRVRVKRITQVLMAVLVRSPFHITQES